MTFATCIPYALAGLMFAVAVSAHADDVIHDGMTAAELAAFGRRQGWSVDETVSSGSTVVFRIDNTLAHIQLYDCDGERRCGSGVIRDISYHFLRPTPHGFWHWNLGVNGATGFGPGYVTLQRFISLKGVTNTYLREVIGVVWVKASKSFWKEVDRMKRAEEKER